jgi:hypothetical protein
VTIQFDINRIEREYDSQFLNSGAPNGSRNHQLPLLIFPFQIFCRNEIGNKTLYIFNSILFPPRSNVFKMKYQISTSFSDKILEKVISNYRKEKHYGITRAKKNLQRREMKIATIHFLRKYAAVVSTLECFLNIVMEKGCFFFLSNKAFNSYLFN